MNLRHLLFFFLINLLYCGNVYGNCIDVEDKLNQVESISFHKIDQSGESFKIVMAMEFVSLLCFNIDFVDIMRFYAYTDEGSLVGEVHISSEDRDSVDSVVKIDSLEGKYDVRSGMLDLKIVPNEQELFLELGEIYINNLSIPLKNVAPVYEVFPYEEQIFENRGSANITYAE